MGHMGNVLSAVRTSAGKHAAVTLPKRCAPSEAIARCILCINMFAGGRHNWPASSLSTYSMRAGATASRAT